MNAKHTPGPWNTLGECIFSFGERGANICAVSEPRVTEKVKYTELSLDSLYFQEAMANAQLIAAAPELLAALQALTTNPHVQLGDLVYVVREREGLGWEGPSVVAWERAMEASHAAIARATGEAP